MFKQGVGGALDPLFRPERPNQASRERRLAAAEIAAQVADEPVSRVGCERGAESQGGGLVRQINNMLGHGHARTGAFDQAVGR